MANKSKNISWTQIIIVALILVFIGIIYFGGNQNNENYNYDNNYAEDNNDNLILNEETITISGVDKVQEISNNAPIKLVISGVRNTITIKENTQVNQIIVSGVDITIYLPEGNNPKITDSGVRTKISYY
jgi:hypothetical protein